MEVIAITGTQLRTLLAVLSTDAGPVYTLRLAFDEGGAKFKVNNGMWSPAFGEVEK